MNDEEIMTKVFAAVADKQRKDETNFGLTRALSLKTSFKDLDYDSLDGADFACHLSDRVGFEVPEQELCTLRGTGLKDSYQNITLGDVVNYIRENQERLQPVNSRPRSQS